MIKTQIQFPDGLYRRLKRLAEEQEWSVAETLRRGAELLLATRRTSEQAGSAPAWKLAPPSNTGLRVDPFADDSWRLLANAGAGASEIAGLEPTPASHDRL